MRLIHSSSVTFITNAQFLDKTAEELSRSSFGKRKVQPVQRRVEWNIGVCCLTYQGKNSKKYKFVMV